MPNPKLEGRNGDVWQHWAVKRWDQDRIAEKFGITQQRVSQIVAAVQAELGPVDRAEMIRRSTELYQSTIAKMHELAEMAGAPVTAGKDGDIVLDPETGKPVRDYALRLSALKLANDTDAQLRKLLGLDSATKIETTGSMKIEIVGVSPEDDLT